MASRNIINDLSPDILRTGIRQNVILSPETWENVVSLVSDELVAFHELSKPQKTLSKNQLYAAARAWISAPGHEDASLKFEIALLTDPTKARSSLIESFLEANPHLSRSPGRPKGFSPAKFQAAAIGIIVGKLANIGLKTLRKEYQKDLAKLRIVK